jgi:nitrous oxidase accessory protein
MATLKHLGYFDLRALAVLLLGCALLPSAASARTWVVGRDAVDLPTALTQSQDGDRVELAGRTHVGSVRVERAVTLVGPGTIDGAGKGHTVILVAAGAKLEGLTVIRSGTELGTSDACVYIGPKAKGAQVLDVSVRDCTFGIYVDQTEDSHIERCRVVGSVVGQRSLRGNGIHLFDATRVTLVGNDIRGGRDGIYVSATEHSLIADNHMADTRFGVHYMFSHHNHLRGNVAENNVTGYAIMQSGNIKVEDNTARGNTDHGILFRDAFDSKIINNHTEMNGEGLFFFSSVDNVIVGNRMWRNGVGAKIWAGSDRNEVHDNQFIGNRRQIFYVATADLVWGQDGRGNLWGDYLGWDQDGDGVGDRPYRVDSFSAHLLYRFPQAVLLLRSPALELLALLSERMPLWQVKTIIDLSPQARTDVAAIVSP